MRSRERGQLADMNLHDFDIMTEAKEEGLAEGARQKAIEDAVMLVRDYNESPEIAAQKMGAPLEDVLEALADQPAQAAN